uniref:Uncharacterized protein n=1 Tax=Ciona savignyi TaxID=51511 RepID=H2YFT2_CIOSA
PVPNFKCVFKKANTIIFHIFDLQHIGRLVQLINRFTVDCDLCSVNEAYDQVKYQSCNSNNFDTIICTAFFALGCEHGSVIFGKRGKNTSVS